MQKTEICTIKSLKTQEVILEELSDEESAAIVGGGSLSDEESAAIVGGGSQGGLEGILELLRAINAREQRGNEEATSLI